MPQIRPFAAIRYGKGEGSDLSDRIAPPFDVLDDRSKAELQSRSEHNIVNIDLPFLPPKAVGPDEVYVEANATLQNWLASGVLERSPRAAIYPYMQSFEHNGRINHRRGFFAAVRVTPFGDGHVVPHELTYRGAIEDRLRLMRATGVQLSPIFGLYSDTRHEVINLIYRELGRPEVTATLDGVRNDLWSVHDTDVERQVIDFLGRRSVYIADGHHRYTTAATRLQELEAINGGPLPPNHPANYCMFALVGMQDNGLLILPTHRLVGNLRQFDIDVLAKAVAGVFDVSELKWDASRIPEFVDVRLPLQPAHTFGLYDGRSRRLYEMHCRDQDVLRHLEPNHSDAWRRLDVAILQRYLLDEIIRPTFASGNELAKGYSATGEDIAERTDGSTFQIALLLKSTPLGALEQLSVHNEVMPQKSTYFYPKLATGLLINPIA